MCVNGTVDVKKCGIEQPKMKTDWLLCCVISAATLKLVLSSKCSDSAVGFEHGSPCWPKILREGHFPVHGDQAILRRLFFSLHITATWCVHCST